LRCGLVHVSLALPYGTVADQAEVSPDSKPSASTIRSGSVPRQLGKAISCLVT
jgi:hypothetical protein